ncbi:MAG: ABC transporter ATP-binding protein [Chloroflexota bacterium]|nr:ABC transporter ATP-binding protein [Dehalococcoidia bacterium]MDW8252679.1 ABC transporter ATP-binding protein [Chloroflexota bacterium]
MHDVSVRLRERAITALVGPNGSGKSTLLRTMARLLQPERGVVLLDGRAITSLPTREVARRLGVLPQAPSAPAGLTVRELVEQGRFPYLGPLRLPGARDREAVDRALEMTELTAFADRPLDTLSGGERQRAWIALVLAQDPAALLLDEPTTYLDIEHQLQVLQLLRRLPEERGMTIAVVLHDLNHASRFADRIVVLQEGRVVTEGPPETVVTAEVLAQVFRVRAHLLHDPVSGRPAFLPLATLK